MLFAYLKDPHEALRTGSFNQDQKSNFYVIILDIQIIL